MVLFTANWFELYPEIEKSSGLAGIRTELDNLEQNFPNSVKVREFELSPDFDFKIHGLVAVPTMQFFVDGAPTQKVSDAQRSAPWIANTINAAYDLVGSSSKVREELCRFFTDRSLQPEPKKHKPSPRTPSRQIPANIPNHSWNEIAVRFRHRLDQANGRATGIQVGRLSEDNVLTYHHLQGLNSFLSEVDLALFCSIIS